MKLRRASRNRKPPKDAKTARRIYHTILFLSAASVVALGGIGGYAFYGVGGMLAGIMIGFVFALLFFL